MTHQTLPSSNVLSYDWRRQVICLRLEANRAFQILLRHANSAMFIRLFTSLLDLYPAFYLSV